MRPLEIARDRYIGGNISIEDFEMACDHWILGHLPIPLDDAVRIYGTAWFGEVGPNLILPRLTTTAQYRGVS
jgi:hypothetical protein